MKVLAGIINYFSVLIAVLVDPLFSWQTCTEKAGGKSGTD